MPLTLTYFQGLMLVEIEKLGYATTAEVCSKMAWRLDKSVQYQNSTITKVLVDLFETGYLECFEKLEGEGDFSQPIKHYHLTDKGREYIRIGQTRS